MRNSLSFKIILHISLLCLLIGSASWTYFVKNNLLATLLILAFLIGEISWLIYDLNAVNRKLIFFFEAVRNEDTSLRFPLKKTSPTIRHLHREMNRVNELIQQTKIKQIEQEQFFKLAMDHAATGILTINEEGFIPFANRAAKDLLNYPPLSHLKQLIQVDRNLFQAIRDIKAGEKRMLRLFRQNSQVELLIHATSFSNQQEHLRIVSIQNLKTEFEQKEQDAWIKLIRVLSHEMINTIAPISSLAQTLYTYYENLPSSENETILLNRRHAKNTLKGLRVIEERGQGLVNFVEKYRKLTRLPQTQKQKFLFSDLVDQLRILLSSEKNAQRIQFSINIQPQDMEIYADKDQISQALLNILINAFQVLEDRKDGEVLLKAFLDEEGKIHIGIIDNGPGIPAKHLSEIFVPFFTTKEMVQEIGLSLSRQIIQQNGASLEVRSTLGEGTSFWIIEN